MICILSGPIKNFNFYQANSVKLARTPAMGFDKPWVTVNRRKHKQGANLTSFFVSNLPDGAVCEDLKALFKEYRKVVDVYIANKKDKGGSNFGFVKFSDVVDARELEGSFKRMYLGSNVLTINIARFQRKMPIHVPVNPSSVRNTSHNPPPASAWLLRGSKTFANIVAGSVHTAKPTHMRINLKPSSDIDNTLFSSFLLGEANNLDTLKAIPSLLKDAGIICGKVFYYGGLCTLIGFDEEADASNFLANSETWKQWFSWVKKGDSTINWKFERIIEVKIVGLPLQFRTTENFQKILAHRGKILDMGDDYIWKFVDLSHVNVCLLSESKTKINEEIIIEHGKGKYFTIGIVEDVCFLNPFVENATSVNGDHMENDQEDRDDASSKGGISDTYSINSEKETIPGVEEGEFIPEDGNGAGYPAKDSVVFGVNKGGSKVSGVNQVGNNVSSVNKVNSKVSGVNQVGNTSNASNNEIDDFNAGIVEETSSNEVGDAFKDKGNLDMTSNDSKVISTEKHILFNGVDDTINVPWGPSTLDGSCFKFGSALKKRRRFSPTKRAHFAGLSDPSGVLHNASEPSIDLNRNINSG